MMSLNKGWCILCRHILSADSVRSPFLSPRQVQERFTLCLQNKIESSLSPKLAFSCTSALAFRTLATDLEAAEILM
jgi:hypothetical protein